MSIRQEANIGLSCRLTDAPGRLLCRSFSALERYPRYVWARVGVPRVAYGPQCPTRGTRYNGTRVRDEYNTVMGYVSTPDCVAHSLPDRSSAVLMTNKSVVQCASAQEIQGCPREHASVLEDCTHWEAAISGASKPRRKISTTNIAQQISFFIP